MVSKIESDVFVDGNLRARTLTLPAGAVGDNEIKAAAAVAATKLQQQYAISYRQDDGADVVSATVPIHTVRGVTAKIIDVDVVCIDAPSGAGDKKFTVDLQRCDQGVPTPSTVLQSPIDYANGSGDCTVLTGTILAPDLADGDTLVVVVTASGTTGVQGQGLVVTVTLREDPE